MSIVLYWHNVEPYEALLQAYKDDIRRAGVCKATGGGKSFLLLKWIEDHPEHRVLVLYSSLTFAAQFDRYVEKYHMKRKVKNTQLITYQKLVNMTDDELSALEPDFIFCDEVHHTGSDQWGVAVKKLLELHPDAMAVGVSATPTRYLDGNRDMIEELFEGRYICNQTLGWMIHNGVFPKPIYKIARYNVDGMLASMKSDVDGIKDVKKRREAKAAYERARRELVKLKGVDKLFLDDMPRNGKILVFCIDIAHTEVVKEQMTEWLKDVNTNLHHYISVSGRQDKDEQIDAFIADEDDCAIRLLYTVDRLNEAVHIDDVDGAVLLRPTESPIVFLQQIGRCFSAGRKTAPIIFDLVNNIRSIRRHYPGGSNPITYIPGKKTESKELCDKIFGGEIEDVQRVLDEFENACKRDVISFEEHVANCVAHKEQYGHFPFPSENDFEAKWIENIRWMARNGCLADEKRRVLLECGIVTQDILICPLVSRKDSFMNHLAACVAHERKYGHLPKYNENPVEANWMKNIRDRARNGKLSVEQLRLLQNAKIVTEKTMRKPQSRKEKFLSHITSCVEHKDKYGHFPYPSESKVDAQWMSDIRMSARNGKLSAKELQVLQKTGIVTESTMSKHLTPEDSFRDKLAACIAHKKKCGHFPFPSESIKLSQWMSDIRRAAREGKLPAEQLQALQDAKIVTEETMLERPTREAAFQQNLATCLSYKLEFGHFPTRSENRQLSQWMSDVRRQVHKGTASPERAKLLLEAGIITESDLPS